MGQVLKLAACLKPAIPKKIWKITRAIYYAALRIKGRPKSISETSKAKPRRIREMFFEKYCNGAGLDIGYGGDLLIPNCKGWDIEHGDAQYLDGIIDAEFDFVYSSHTLEHMMSPDIALENWWRVVKAGGYLILYIPHRELYEKSKTLPSRWNLDHKHFFLIDMDEAPDTVGILPLIQRTLSDFEIIYARECSEGHTITNPEIHSDGEYSIEIVIHKLNTKSV
jgi:SAM-dependent methyltransferase